MDKLHLPVQFSQVTSLPGPSAKDKLAANIDGIFQRYQERPISSSQSLHASGATSSPLPGTLLQSLTSERRLYRLRVQSRCIDLSTYHIYLNVSKRMPQITLLTTCGKEDSKLLCRLGCLVTSMSPRIAQNLSQNPFLPRMFRQSWSISVSQRKSVN